MTDECLFCDATDDLEEHHVVPRRYGGTDGEENLITVCGDCHKKIERTWDRRFYHEIGVRDGLTPNMMFDAIKELHTTLVKTKAAVKGYYGHYEEGLEAAGDATVEDYGGKVTRRQVLAIKREAMRELHDGDFYPGFSIEELDELEDRGFQLLDYLDEEGFDR